MTYKLTLGKDVLFEAAAPQELAQHLVENFPPAGDFPSPNPHNTGFAIVLPNGERLQSLKAERWVRQNSPAGRTMSTASDIAAKTWVVIHDPHRSPSPYAAYRYSAGRAHGYALDGMSYEIVRRQLPPGGVRRETTQSDHASIVEFWDY